MLVLTVNSGSSSLKLAVVDAQDGRRVRALNLALPADPLAEAGEAASKALAGFMIGLDASHRPQVVAHRIVHGGERFRRPVLINDEVRTRLGSLCPLAPLHTPQALALVDRVRELLPDCAQVAVFDTSFHATLPLRARRYALPAKLCEEEGIRRFGFHGLSHHHVADAVARFVTRPARSLKIISCHLGNGASMTAIEHGASTETSMGMTPLEGLVMGTRAGDLDSGALLTLLRSGRFSIKELDSFLNTGAGVKGMTGTTELQDVEARAASGDEECRTALAVYGHRIRKYIGAYAAVMGGVDVIAFTGGIGEHSAAMRSRCTQRLAFLGATLDEDRNRSACVSRELPVIDIADEASAVRIVVVAADEERIMAQEAAAAVARGTDSPTARIPVAISARRAHLATATLARLFGADFALREHAPVGQPGQFAALETVSLVGPRGRIDNVRLIGPPRSNDQIEISRSDEFVLGVDAPVRDSDDLNGTPGIGLEGPNGQVALGSGLICARRHIHMHSADAARLQLRDGALVAVRLGPHGETTFRSVRVRVSDHFVTQLQLDVDEANAARVAAGDWAEVLSDDDAQSEPPFGN